MAYQSKNLSVLAYGNGFTLWHYVCDVDDVLSEGYFNEAYPIVRDDDLVIVTSAPGYRILSLRKDNDVVAALPHRNLTIVALEERIAALEALVMPPLSPPTTDNANMARHGSFRTPVTEG